MPRKKAAAREQPERKPRKPRGKKALREEALKEDAKVITAEQGPVHATLADHKRETVGTVPVESPPPSSEETAFAATASQVIEAAEYRQEAARMEDVGKQLGKELGSQPEMEHANADAEERAAIQEESTHVTRVLTGAKPRKSGRRPWDLNRGTPGHCWERQTTPGGEEVIFKFKDEPDARQMELIARYGFTYDENVKEAYQPNTPEGRQNADRLAWYLKEYQRGQTLTAVAP